MKPNVLNLYKVMSSGEEFYVLSETIDDALNKYIEDDKARDDNPEGGLLPESITMFMYSSNVII